MIGVRACGMFIGGSGGVRAIARVVAAQRIVGTIIVAVGIVVVGAGVGSGGEAEGVGVEDEDAGLVARVDDDLVDEAREDLPSFLVAPATHNLREDFQTLDGPPPHIVIAEVGFGGLGEAELFVETFAAGPHLRESAVDELDVGRVDAGDECVDLIVELREVAFEPPGVVEA